MNPVMKTLEFSEAEKSDMPKTIRMPSEVVLLENDDDVIKLLTNTVDILSIHTSDPQQAQEKVKQLLEEGKFCYIRSQPDKVDLIYALEDGTMIIWSYQLDLSTHSLRLFKTKRIEPEEPFASTPE